MRPLRAARVLLAAALAANSVPARAGDATRSFAESDRNRDGAVDRREMERRALEVFHFADNEKDGYLGRDEFDALVLEDDFAAVDSDGDGRVTTREFVAARVRDFDAADADRDGTLRADELP